MKSKLISIGCLCLTVFAAHAAEPVSIGNGVYEISIQKGTFRPARSTVMSDVVKAADKHCADQGKTKKVTHLGQGTDNRGNYPEAKIVYSCE